MSMTNRMILILTLSLAASGVFAQEDAQNPEMTQSATTTIAEQGETPDDPAAEPEVAEVAPEDVSSYELQREFGDLLIQHPYDLATILALDPTLINDETYLSRYPEVARFVADHPEISRNPSFYVANFEHRTQRGGVIDDILEPIIIFAVFVLIAYALAWIVRTMVEQKRWNRLSQTQSEVHNKILDRFGASDEVLAYIKSPAGAKFLEAAPIPLHAEAPSQNNSSLTRIMLSVQFGVVVAVGSLGMLLVSFRLPERTGDELFAFGLIAFCVGAGFIISAGVSLFMSQRLGLWDFPGSQKASAPSTDPGTVR